MTRKEIQLIIPDEVIRLIAENADGSMRDAENMLELIIAHGRVKIQDKLNES